MRTVTFKSANDVPLLSRLLTYHGSVEDGISTVIVSGRSYLDAVASEKKAGGGGEPINLEGGDAGIQRVLDHHGVTLPACVQTFDLMQVMNWPIRHWLPLPVLSFLLCVATLRCES